MTRRVARYGRREFLVRTGLVGAAVALVDVPSFLDAAPGDAATLAQLAPILDALSTDTINGLVAFVVPGPDAYSVAQGVSDTAPGGIDANGTGFLLSALDFFYPVPQEPLRLLVQSLETGLNNNLPPLSGVSLLSAQPALIEQLDLALGALLNQQGAVPLSLVVALLLNFLATLVDPAAHNGTFLSPFSRLSFAEKARAFALVEQEATAVAAMLDSNLPEPLKDSLSGFLEFLSGALLEFAAFGSFSEYGVFNPTTRTLGSTPVGWRLSQYQVAPGISARRGLERVQGVPRRCDPGDRVMPALTRVHRHEEETTMARDVIVVGAGRRRARGRQGARRAGPRRVAARGRAVLHDSPSRTGRTSRTTPTTRSAGTSASGRRTARNRRGTGRRPRTPSCGSCRVWAGPRCTITATVRGPCRGSSWGMPERTRRHTTPRTSSPSPTAELIPYYQWVEATLPVQTAAMGTKEEVFFAGAATLGIPHNTHKNVTTASYRPQENAILQPQGTRRVVHRDPGQRAQLAYPAAQGCTFCGYCFQGCKEPIRGTVQPEGQAHDARLVCPDGPDGGVVVGAARQSR